MSLLGVILHAQWCQNHEFRSLQPNTCEVRKKKIGALHNNKYGALDSILATLQEDGEPSAVQYLTSPLLPLN